MKTNFVKRLSTGILAAVITASLFGCGANNTNTPSSSNSQTPAQQEEKTIRLGVVGENNEQWSPVANRLAEEGIKLELVKFADYTLPNQALAGGEIDLNAFQHYAFLNNEFKEKGLELTAIGETIIAPLGLYSKKITSVDQLKEGDSIAIPSDATNGGRSLKLLEAAGLIKVDPQAGYTPEVSDITENPLKLKFTQIEAAQSASLLPDVAAAVINGGHAVDNGLNPEKDAIYLETVQEGSDNPYINIIAVRTKDKDNELYRKVLEYFRSDEVAQVIKEAYKGAYLPTWN